MGQFDGDPVWIMYYAYTVYGVWYSKSNLDKLDAEYPETWDEMLGAVREGEEEGRRAAGRTRASTRTTCRSRSTPSSARSAAARSSTRSTTWSRTPGRTRPSRPRFEAYYELYKKGYILKGTPGLTHIESQTAWTKGKALFIPNGSWVENEAAKTTPKDFEMAVAAPSSLDKRRQDAVRHHLGLRR